MVTFQDPDWDVRRPAGSTPVLNTCGLMGEGGLDCGPHYYLLDECALADPLLARLPAVFKEEWRPGHFRRWVPTGTASRWRAEATHQEPAAAQFYDHLSRITRSGRPVSSERLRAIWRMNTGAYATIDEPRLLPVRGVREAPRGAGGREGADETPWDAPGTSALPQPLAVRVRTTSGPALADVSVDSNDKVRR